jgi:hypothetical protein
MMEQWNNGVKIKNLASTFQHSIIPIFPWLSYSAIPFYWLCGDIFSNQPRKEKV